MSFLFIDPPSANITVSLISVIEGEEVSIMCRVDGVGPLSVEWRAEANQSSLPEGVEQRGRELFISTASRLHAGTYICSVGNPAGVDEDNATLVVYCKCFSRIPTARPV